MPSSAAAAETAMGHWLLSTMVLADAGSNGNMNFYKPTKPDNKNHIFKYTLLTSSQRMSFHNFYNLPTVARGPPDKIFSHK